MATGDPGGTAERTVSVLVPCRNAARFIAETLASVRAQTFRDWELIVVDDGSTDGSADVARACVPHATIIDNSSGTAHGASAARNRALAEARGRFIQYLDADDVLLPHALESRVHALEHANADVAYGDIQRWEEDESGRYTYGAIEPRDLGAYATRDDAAVVRGFWRPPAGLMYSRRITDLLGPWREDLRVAEDARYTIDAALAGARFVHVPGVSALYRVTRSPSLSRRDPRVFVECVMRNTDEVSAIWRARGVLDSDCAHALEEVYGYLARATFYDAPELCAHAVHELRELGLLRLASWPFVAETLARVLGRANALRMLELLGRGAPRWPVVSPPGG